MQVSSIQGASKGDMMSSDSSVGIMGRAKLASPCTSDLCLCCATAVTCVYDNMTTAVKVSGLCKKASIVYILPI